MTIVEGEACSDDVAEEPGGARHYSLRAGFLALAGGLVAILTLQIRRRFSGRAILVWAALYAVFVSYVVATA